MRHLIFIGILGSLFISGCASTALKSNIDIINSNSKISGLPYYLPKGMVNLVIQKEREGGALAIKAAEVEIVPDNAFRYILQYQSNRTSDDAFEVSTTKTGLLSEIKFTADEHTDEFIIKFAELVKDSVKAAFTPFGLVQKDKLYDVIYTASFDPFTELREINSAIQKINPNFEVKFPILDILTNQSPSERSACDQNNVCFRSTSVFPLILKENGIELQRVNLELPDPTIMGQIAVTRAAFVKKVTNLTFNNGTLAKVDINKPSEAIAAIEIPINIVKTFASIPAELIQLKINHSTNNKSLFDALKNEMEAREALNSMNKPSDPINNP